MSFFGENNSIAQILSKYIQTPPHETTFRHVGLVTSSLLTNNILQVPLLIPCNIRKKFHNNSTTGNYIKLTKVFKKN